MTRLRELAARHADLIILVAFILAMTGVCLFWAAHDADNTGRKFCAVVQAATAQRVPKPPDPAANPSRETNYLFYVKFVDLGRSLGCDL